MLKNHTFFIRGAMLSIAICLASLFGLEWAPPPGIFSPVAPVAGIALATLFLEGAYLWPWVVIGSFASRCITYPTTPFVTIFSIVIINTVAYLIGAAYLRRRNTNKELSTLSDVKDVALAAAMVGAIATLCFFFQPYSVLKEQLDSTRMLGVMTQIFFGRFTGILIVGTAIITFSISKVKIPFRRWDAKKLICLFTTFLITLLVFGPFHVAKPFAWLIFPPLIFSALLGGPRLTAQALLLVGMGSLWGTTNHYGPFANVGDPFTTLQQFLSVASITGLTLAAVANERKDKHIIQQRSDDIQFLSDTTAELLSSTSLSSALQKIASGLASRCDIDIVTYHVMPVVQEERPLLVAQFGLPEDRLGDNLLKEIESAIPRALKGDTPVSSSLESTEGGDSGHFSSQHIRSGACYPIVVHNQLLGTLTIASRTRATIDSSEAKLVETVAQDITTAVRRLKQEDQLRESESRFRELASAVPDIVWMSKPDGSPVYYNQRWYDFTGYANTSLPFPPLLDFCHPTQREGVASAWKACLLSGRAFEMEHQLKHSSGEYRWVLTRALPTRDANGVIVRWVGTSTDLHAKKTMEAERDSLHQSERAARIEAERANRLKDDFLATLSHELRNPLNVILGWTHLLSRNGVDISRAARIIEQSARLQAQLIDDLLDMSRIMSGKLSLKRANVHLNDVVAANVDSMQITAQEKGVSLESNIESDIQLDSADVGRITQVVANILTNAIKFTPRGGRVKVTLVQDNGDACLVVSDTGLGIAPEFLPHIFDRFRQADASTTRRHGGLGIGLAIAKHLTSLHGGSISAASPGIGQGATFTVRLPLHYHSPEVSSTSVEAPRLAENTSRGTLRGSRIVVVEDDQPTLEFLERFLSESGAEVVACTDGAAALREVQARKPDLVISDIGMPDMDGYQFARQIRKLTPDDRARLPLVAVTAFAREEDKAKALEAGFDSHIAKPLDAGRLEQSIEHLLAESSKRAA